MAPQIIDIEKLVDGVPRRGPPDGYRDRGRVEWHITLAGIGTVKLTTCQATNYRQVQFCCMKQLFAMPDPIPNDEWLRLFCAAGQRKFRPTDDGQP